MWRSPSNISNPELDSGSLEMENFNEFNLDLNRGDGHLEEPDTIDEYFDELLEKEGRRVNLKKVFHQNKGILLLLLLLLLVCIGVVVLIIILLSVSGGVVAIVVDDDGNSNDSSNDNGDLLDNVLLTKRYEITIGDMREWSEDREAKMSEWMTFFQEKSDFFELSRAKTTSSTRHQYYINASGSSQCQTSSMFKVEEFLSGDETGISIKIKKGGSNPTQVCNYPFKPHTGFDADSSLQLCELDRYNCQPSYYTRETAVYLKRKPSLGDCGDLLKIFPHAFDVSKDDLENSVHSTGNQYWFQQDYTGTMDGDTSYKASFQLKYGSEEDAYIGSDPSTGKWSIRIFTEDDGEWNEDVQKDVKSTWEKMMNHFGDGC